MEKANSFAPPQKPVANAVTYISMHMHSKNYHAHTKRCLGHCNIINLLPVWRCVLLQDTWCPHCLIALLSFYDILPCSHCIPVPLHCAHRLLQMVLTPIMWQLLFGLNYCQLPWPKAEGHSEPSQNHLEPMHCFPVWYTEQELQQKATAEYDVEGDVAFPQCLFKISHLFPRPRVKDLVWKCHFCK